MKHFLFAAVLLALASCHTTKKATVTKAPEPVQVEVAIPDTSAVLTAAQVVLNTKEQGDSLAASDTLATKADTVVQLTESIYRFKVSFISIGEGIDYKAKRKFTGFINDYESK